MKHTSFNQSTEMYLKTISELAEAQEPPVPISALAERMGVSNVSATEMVHRLEDQQLLIHTPYKGVTLTNEGQRSANSLIRSHHLWECFLADVLGLPWEQVHDYACELEHATDSAVTEALAAHLNHPTRCPHGNLIPDAQGVMPTSAETPLTSLQPGQSAKICRIAPESTLLLDYLGSRDLKPGHTLQFTEIAPFNGPLIVTVNGRDHALGREIAGHIFVETTELSHAA